MNFENFLADFEAQFEEVKPGVLNADTELESIDEWGSLQELVIISMIDSKYKVQVKADELGRAKTVRDIYDLVKIKASW